MVSQAERMKIWCLLRDQFAHVKPVEDYLGSRAEFIYDDTWEPDILLANRPDLVLCVNDYHYAVARCLDAARQALIPSLVLQDGILEWRCQYENPLFGAGDGAPQHQPVLADKIACLGWESARHIAAWGNAAKVEITGMPRLDILVRDNTPPPQRPGKRILIMTAKKPWFNLEQKEVILRSLNDVKDYLAKNPAVEVVWRLTKEVENIIGVENRLKELSTSELSGIVSKVDAVITTPSTTILEAMLLKRPVAVLDYHNVPRFVPTPWTISAPEHIAVVIKELLAPPAAKMSFQQDCLDYCLRADGPAAGLVADLITKMIEISKSQNSLGQHLKFSANLLSYQEIFSPGTISLAEIYPEQTLFAENDLQALQIRHARLFKENERLQEELKKRNLGYWVMATFHYLIKGKNRKNLK